MKNWKSFLLSGLTLYVVLCASKTFAQKCYDIHLQDGTVIEGVQCKIEEVYGIKYLVYRYRDHEMVKRIEYAAVKRITEADCQIVPTPPSRPTPSSSTPGTVNHEYVGVTGRMHYIVVLPGTSKSDLRSLGQQYIQKYGESRLPTIVNIFDSKDAYRNRDNPNYPESQYFQHWIYQLIQARDGSTSESFPNEM